MNTRAVERQPEAGRTERALECVRSSSPKAQYTQMELGMTTPRVYNNTHGYTNLNLVGRLIASNISLPKTTNPPTKVCNVTIHYNFIVIFDTFHPSQIKREGNIISKGVGNFGKLRTKGT